MSDTNQINKNFDIPSELKEQISALLAQIKDKTPIEAMSKIMEFSKNIPEDKKLSKDQIQEIITQIIKNSNPKEQEQLQKFLKMYEFIKSSNNK